jgi:sarcosine oxidase gamma subunit
MTLKPNRWFWSMKRDRELIALAESTSLQAIADQLQRPLGLSIKGRKAKGK